MYMYKCIHGYIQKHMRANEDSFRLSDKAICFPHKFIVRGGNISPAVVALL